MNRLQIVALALLPFLFHGTLSPLWAFDPAQQDDSQAVLRHFASAIDKQSKPPAFSGGRFDVREGETIIFIGGSEMEEMAEAGYFEAHLQRAFAARRPQVRSIAWSADTVYRQQRPMFFFTAQGDTREGSLPDGRQRIEAGVLIVQFGKMESLDGEEQLASFQKAYETLIGELMKFSPRIVLLSPSPFFETGPAGKLAEERNVMLEKYSSAVEAVARKHDTLFFDLRAGLGVNDPSLSRNGVHLSDKGKQAAARLLAAGLWNSDNKGAPDETVRSAIHKKNFLWQQYFRPTNWAFLYGDRQHVPSSRGHKDTDRRWFIEELNQLPGRIAAADSDIWKEAGQ